MKATGVVRRLDDLGRLVIPKEIRKQYRLKEGDSIEIFTDDERIIIQKFNTLTKHIEEIKLMCETLEAMFENTVLFIQDEKSCLQSRKLKEMFCRSIRQVRNAVDFEKELIFDDEDNAYGGRIYPIISNSDWIGAFVIVYDKHVMSKDDFIAVEAFVKLLSRQQHQ